MEIHVIVVSMLLARERVLQIVRDHLYTYRLILSWRHCVSLQLKLM